MYILNIFKLQYLLTSFDAWQSIKRLEADYSSLDPLSIGQTGSSFIATGGYLGLIHQVFLRILFYIFFLNFISGAEIIYMYHYIK